MTWSHHRRSLFALALVTFLAASLPPTTHAAAPPPAGRTDRAEPHRPLPGYRPAFVTETDTRPPFKDCLWAVGSMLLDKWSAGELDVSRRRLRTLSGDRLEGSTLVDLAHAFGRVGLDLTFSPDGGARITWPSLLRRLREGGGAVLLGDYGNLPRRYGRWDLAFWQKEGRDDNHALYLDAYDATHHRVWVMDPLARGDWQGEWVPVSALRRFAWRTRGGNLWAAMTPKAERAPFAGVELGAASIAVGPETASVDWAMTTHPAGWTLPPADLRVDVARLDSGIVAAGVDVAVVPPAAPAAGPALPPEDLAGSAGSPVDGVVRPAPGPVLTALPDVLRATFPVPVEAGVYRVRLLASERRFGRTVAAAGPYTVFVPGPRHAAIVARAPTTSVTAGGSVQLGASVTNDGSASWADPMADGGPGEPAVRRSTAVWGHWLAADADTAAAAEAAGEDPPPVRLEPVPFDPGDARIFWLTVPAPSAPGAWTLVLDVADELDGSFAAAGSQPASVAITVVAPMAPLGLFRR